ncbi:MAG: RNA methyltransferase [Candidatus Gastranaerophilaceae bacterium]|jgi:TrmH family RNA methyltransferase
MKTITSINNEIVKETVKLQQKKYRNQTGFFLLEGIKTINEAVISNINITKIFVQKGVNIPLSVIRSASHNLAIPNAAYGTLPCNSRFARKQEELQVRDDVKQFVKPDSLPLLWKNIDIYEVTEAVIKKISTTETPPEIVAIAQQKKYSIEDLFQSRSQPIDKKPAGSQSGSAAAAPLIVVIEDIKDAGNLGTIIRTAAAGNVSGIVLYGDTVDLYNPKTVRSAVGNLWKIPIVELNEKLNLKETLLQYGKYKFFATVVNNTKKPDNCFITDFKGPSVIMFGSEADGLSKDLINQADCLITIPMKENVESLNLSMSVGIIVYESLRQRLYV